MSELLKVSIKLENVLLSNLIYILLQLFDVKIYDDVFYSILLLETHAIIAVTDCDEVHKAEKKAAERGVLFMGVTGTNVYIFLWFSES